MIFFKLCCVLIWPLVFSLPQVKNPLRANTSFPRTLETPPPNPRSTQCQTSVENNGKTMAYCFGSWPQSMPGTYDEVRITKAMKNELNANLLRSIRVKQVLRIKDCDVQTIQTRTFTTFASLTILDLSRNLITRIEPEAFSGLSRLQELKLSENRITSVGPNAFAELVNLNILELQYNQLNEMPTALPKTLQVLNLASNQLELTKQQLQLPNLINLNLCGNRLDEYPEEFLNCPKLETLCIEEITLKATTSFPFRNIPGLKTLNINGDKSSTEPIPKFSTGAQYLTQLEQLTITQTTLSDWSFLTYLQELRSLSLISVQVQTHLQEYQFASCKKLEQLDLSNSEQVAHEITRNKVLVNLQSLKKLVLSECQLQYLGWLPKQTPKDVTPTQPKILPQLEILDISKNPLQCKDPETQHALCYLSQMTHDFSLNIDPRIVNRATTSSPIKRYGPAADYDDNFDREGETQPTTRYPDEQHTVQFQLMDPQETVCEDMQRQSVYTIGQEFCHNLPELTTSKPTSPGNAGSTDELSGRESSGLSTETIWYIVLGVILGLLLLTVIVLCIVCTKKNRGHHDIDGEPPAPTFQALKQQASSQDALLDGHKK